MQFLHQLPVYILILFLCEAATSQSESQNNAKPLQVIIVGGGAAGIAAATRLDQHNVSFILLEAEARLGGRVHSAPFGAAVVDVGAEWVHGEKGNVVYEMLKDTGLLHHHANPRYKMFSSHRDEEISEEFSGQLLSIFLQLYDEAASSGAEESVGDFFTRRYLKIINEKYATHEAQRRIALQALPLLEKHICSLESSPNWHLPSAQSDHVACEGDDFTHWNGKGYYTALEHLMRDFNATDKVFTAKEVTGIDYAKERVIVSGDGFSHEADYVLFTPSLGVLKHSHAALFTPPLSALKAQAIEAMGFGAVAKVWMEFAKPWWPVGNFTGLSFVWSCEDRLTLAAQFPKGPRKNGKSWLMDLYGVYDTPQNPNVLSAWLTGEFIPDIEKLTDEELLDGIFFVLDKFAGHLYQIERPIKVLRGKWHSNKHFRGTYSYQTVASRRLTPAEPSAITVLAAPVASPADNKMRLFFGGEATNLQHYSTVHGAIESGFREADRLIGLITPK